MMYKEILFTKEAHALHHPDAMMRVLRPGMQKTASADLHDSPLHPLVQEYISCIEPDDNSTWVLVNALGAGEWYGQNINGDYFPYRELVTHTDDWLGLPVTDRAARHMGSRKIVTGYPSFYDAHVFKHHCFPAGTLVCMGDGQRRPIEEVVEGDYVRGGSSASVRVMETMQRDYSGPGVKLSVSGVPEPIVCTENHPLYVYHHSEIYCEHGYSRLHPNFGCRHKECVKWAKDQPRPAWTEASKVSVGDHLLVPTASLGKHHDPELLSLAGYVASEGYLGKKGDISFTFSPDSTEDIEQVVSLLTAHTTNKISLSTTKHGSRFITVCDKELHNNLSSFVGGVLSEKTITSELYKYDRSSLLSFLGSYINGDGHVCNKGRNKGQLRIRSSSKQMLASLSDVIRSLGYPCSVVWDTKPSVMTSPTNGKEYKTSGSGCVAVNKTYAAQVTCFSYKHIGYRSEKETHFPVLGHGHLLRVTETESIELDEPVYNLEVGGDHSYTAGEVLVHNCNKDPAKSFGDVMAAIWNERMKRVELILRIDHDRAEKWLASEIISRVNDGDFPDVSMGCFRSKSARILTKDLTEICIGEIQQGDVVLTHKGRWSTVTEVFSQPHKGPTYNIHVYGWRNPLELTGEHPLWLMRKECAQCHPSSKSVNRGRKQRVCADSLRLQKRGCDGCTSQPDYFFDWVRADEASIGDYLATPVLAGEQDLYLPDHHVELMGHYLAEGYTSTDKKGNKLVHFCLGLHEKDKGDHIQNMLAETPSTRWISSHVAPARSGLYISAKSDYLHQLFTEHIGSGAKNKKLSADLCRLNRRQQKILLGAYADGDGGEYKGALYFSTASEDLAKQLQMILLRHHMIASINTIAHRPSEKSVVRVDTIEYQVWVGSNTAYLLDGHTSRLDLSTSSKRANSKRFFIKHEGTEYLVSPIIAIDEEEYDDSVYNFSVDGDDSYVAEGLAVHNCKVPYDVCFPPGTAVKCNGGFESIENVREGFHLPSHMGKQQQVVSTLERDYDGELIRVNMHGSYRIVSMTPNHPVLSLARDQVRQPAGRRRIPEEIKVEPQWKPAEDLVVGDFLLHPLTAELDKDGDSRFARLCGLYAGDGFRIRQRTGKKKNGPYRLMGLGFSCSMDEDTHVSTLLELLASYGGDPKVYQGGDKNALSVRWYNQDIADKVVQLCGDLCSSKKVPSYLMYASIEERLSFLGGLIDTDGSQDHNKKLGDIRICGVNEQLMFGSYQLALSSGINASISKVKSTGGFENTSEHYYQLFIPASQSSVLSTYSVKVKAYNKNSSSQGFFWNAPDGTKYYASPVQSVESVPYCGKVYNLQVSEDESYLVDGWAVHNCSICGNKAKTKEQYCVHINERRTNRDPRGDGQRPYMINIKPRFFDISFVFIGADKTARVLKKLAGAEVEKTARAVPGLFGKVTGKAVGQLMPRKKEKAVDEKALQQLLYKASSLQKEGKQLKLADIIKYVVPNKDAARVSKIMGGEPDLPEEAQDELARKGIDGAAEETARGGMVLKPHEFMRIALVGSGLKDLADKLRGKTLPASDDVELPMHPCPMHGSSGMHNSGFRHLFMDRDVTPPMIVKREVRIIMMSPKSQLGNLQEEKSPLLDKISAAYNGYRLWLLANQSELGLNKEASAPSLAAGFGSRAIEEVAGDPELTEAYLLAAHWQAGGR